MTTDDKLAEKDWIRTPGAMDAACVGVVVRSASGTIAARYNKDLAVLFGDERPIPWWALSLPLQILWDPRTSPEQPSGANDGE